MGHGIYSTSRPEGLPVQEPESTHVLDSASTLLCPACNPSGSNPCCLLSNRKFLERESCVFTGMSNADLEIFPDNWDKVLKLQVRRRRDSERHKRMVLFAKAGVKMTKFAGRWLVVGFETVLLLLFVVGVMLPANDYPSFVGEEGRWEPAPLGNEVAYSRPRIDMGFISLFLDSVLK
jgi:hypothetical protein